MTWRSYREIAIIVGGIFAIWAVGLWVIFLGDVGECTNVLCDIGAQARFGRRMNVWLQWAMLAGIVLGVWALIVRQRSKAAE